MELAGECWGEIMPITNATRFRFSVTREEQCPCVQEPQTDAHCLVCGNSRWRNKTSVSLAEAMDELGCPLPDQLQPMSDGERRARGL